MVILQQLVI